jgi:hypothetical protein
MATGKTRDETRLRFWHSRTQVRPSGINPNNPNTVKREVTSSTRRLLIHPCSLKQGGFVRRIHRNTHSLECTWLFPVSRYVLGTMHRSEHVSLTETPSARKRILTRVQELLFNNLMGKSIEVQLASASVFTINVWKTSQCSSRPLSCGQNSNKTRQTSEISNMLNAQRSPQQTVIPRTRPRQPVAFHHNKFRVSSRRFQSLTSTTRPAVIAV